jgi:hypothetical protein
MLRKAEFGKLPVQPAHDPVACDLGDDARGGDGKRQPVSFHDRVMRKREIPHRQAVDQAVVRRRSQRFHRASHREMRGSQDVEPVDFTAVRRGYRPVDALVLSQACIKLLPFSGTDFFRVIEARAGETGRQYHRRRSHGASQRPPARFIHSRDPLQAAGEEGGFEGQVWHGQNRLNRSRVDIWELLTVEKSWVAKTMPSESTTTPIPVWVQSSSMFLW